jgi:signal transduction histidine kinase
MLNLVLNARDAMPDGGTIMVEALSIICGNEPMIRLRVIDHGIGMSEQTLRSAFDPFFTTKGMGLGGVGLPMVRHFVEGNGGTIRLESARAQGTIVTLQLPGVRRPAVTGD